MAATSTIEIKDCTIIVTHKLAFIQMSDCDDEKFKAAVEEIKKEITDVWGGQEFSYNQFCKVEFKFEFVEIDEVGNLPDDVDPKMLFCRDGVSEQDTLGPEQSVGRWFMGNQHWGKGVAAHEVGHELGMSDKYHSYDSNGNEVPTWVKGADGITRPNPDADPSRYAPSAGYPRDGIAFDEKGTPQEADILEIMAALNVKCPCPELGDPVLEPQEPCSEGDDEVTPPEQDPEAAKEGSSGQEPEETSGPSDSTSALTNTGWDTTHPVLPERPGWTSEEGNTIWDHPLTPHGNADPPEQDDPWGLRPPDEYRLYGEELDDDRDLRPLAFVPGFMGSSLRINQPNGKPRAVWPIPKTRLDMLPLYPKGDPTYPTGLYPEQYDGLISFICKPRSKGGMGHTLGKDFFIFAYDWTETNQVSGARLNAYIEQKLALINLIRRAAGKTPWEAMDVLNHSMGGIVTRTAHKYGAKMHRMMYLASPHYGSADAYFWAHPDFQPRFMIGGTIKTGITEAAWYLSARPGNRRNLQKAFKHLAQRLPTTYELLPDSFYLDPGDHPIAYRENGTYPTGVEGSYKQGPWRFPRPVHPLVDEAMAFKQWLGADLPGDHQVVYSVHHDTPKFAVFYSARRGRRWYWGPIHKPAFSGDATVPTHSARRRGAGLRVSGQHTPLCNEPDTHGHIKSYFVPERL